ncbi:lipopolysaccharide biosynthesis protein [Rhodoligotrophos defluvii]|uniref:lipopolysaccharide biosynthesis protein n=1 Tax=Rhodoligotrophos defluvii TaxID=2561934 RepID=UPI001EEFE0F6|nr:oligosaccharide flippase family protein [Rhodoligotrophos defluvii]
MFLSKLTSLTKKPFVRNVGVIATGTAAAQLIAIGFSPMITRLYGPEAFGVLGTFTTLVSNLSSLSALTYPIAIVLASDNNEARQLFRLSLITSLLISAAFFLPVFYAKAEISSYFNINEIADFLILLPVTIFFSGWLQASTQYSIRSKTFKLNAHVAVASSLIINITRAGVGLIFPRASALIVIASFGIAFQAALLTIGHKAGRRTNAFDSSPTSLKELAIKFRDFPLFRAPQEFINSVSRNLPILVLAASFGTAAAGFYTLCRTVLDGPTQLITKSVSDAFYPRFHQGMQRGEDGFRLVALATLALAVIGLAPFGLVALFGPTLFSLVFGGEWAEAGEYARWMAIMAFFSFVNGPAVKAMPVLGLQRFLLLYEIGIVAGRLFSLALGVFALGSDVYTVAVFSIVSALGNCVLISSVLIKARRSRPIRHT